MGANAIHTSYRNVTQPLMGLELSLEQTVHVDTSHDYDQGQTTPTLTRNSNETEHGLYG